MPELGQRRSGRPKRVSGALFLFGYLSLYSGILPSALRPNFAVRTRFLGVRGHAKKN
jgi:hypothetical protein